MVSPSSALRRLRQLRSRFDPDAAREKLSLVRLLKAAHLRTANEVARLHDALCFIRAYPDDPELLVEAEKVLRGFDDRRDLELHREALADTGIAGTPIYYRFYWQTAQWLFARWPESVSIDWQEWDNRDDLDSLWPLLLSYPATEAFESLSLSPRQWIERLKRPQDTDAAFLIRSFARWRVEDAVREKTYDDLDVPLVLAPTKGSPSRTHSKRKPDKIEFGFSAWRPGVPHSTEIRRAPMSVHAASPAEGKKLIDLARVQMITRGRDLYAFMNADPNDVRVVSCEGGLQFLCYGLRPSRRTLLEAMYVFLILRNGVPIGYTQAATLMRSAEINFNIFDEFRGTEASRIFVRTLAMVHQLFGSDAFVINTHQLGEGNREAIKSGAFWFYYKHGFRPRDPQVRRLARTERARKKADPSHRSSASTLRMLAKEDLYLFLGKQRADLVNTLPLDKIGLVAAKVLEHHVGAAQSNGTRSCTTLANGLLGYRPTGRLPAGPRIAWERWSPLVLALPGVNRWSPANRRALADLINAKGGRRESDFVALFDRHKPLRTAIRRLGEKAA